jgi:hypothetical protein
MMAPEYLAQRLTPYPLATKDGGVLHITADARAYVLALREQWTARCGEAVEGRGPLPLKPPPMPIKFSFIRLRRFPCGVRAK